MHNRQAAVQVVKRILADTLAGVPDQYVVAVPAAQLVDAVLQAANPDALVVSQYDHLLATETWHRIPVGDELSIIAAGGLVIWRKRSPDRVDVVSEQAWSPELAWRVGMSALGAAVAAQGQEEGDDR